MNMKIIADLGRTKCSEKICYSATFPPQILSWMATELNLELCSEQLVNARTTAWLFMNISDDNDDFYQKKREE